MNFLEAITSAFNNYFNFKGRATRSAFWFFILFEIIYFFVAGFLLGFAGVTDEVFAIAIFVLIIPVVIPGISLTARRLHDFNQSGWMQCIFIPGFFIDEFIGTGYIIYSLTFVLFAIYCSQKSNTGKNRFGPKPKK
ncbi:DUF805 domain-containing protein [Candidatus Pelagibacter sp.]|nr:DUF805 domain-containing protein [Candidatus Pelagibacter sp.]